MDKANKGLQIDHLVQFHHVLKQCSHILKNNPECFFQEFHNRLLHRVEADAVLEQKLRIGRENYTSPWLRLRKGSYESPIISVLTGHKTEISDCCFSPTDNLLVSIDVEGEIRLWDWSNGELINVFQCALTYLRECSFSPCGSRIFILAAENEDSRTYHLVIYGTYSGQYFGSFGRCSESLDRYGVNEKMKLIAIPNQESEIEIIDYQNGQKLEVLAGHKGEVFSTRFDTNGERLASAGEDGNIIEWDISKMDILDVQNWNSQNALCCTFSSDLKTMVAGYDQLKFKIWSVQSGICQVEKQFIELCKKDSDIGIMHIFFHNGLKAVVSEISNNKILILDPKTLGIKLKKGQQQWLLFREKCFSGNGKKMIIGGFIPDYSAYVIDVKQDKQIAHLRGHTFEIENCIISADGRTAATSSCDRSIMIWNIQKAEEIDKMREPSLLGEIQHISPDSRFLLTSSDNNSKLKIWELSNYKLVQSLPGHVGGVVKARFSHDGTKIASIGKEDASLRIWDCKSGLEISSFSFKELSFDDSLFWRELNFYFFPQDDRYIILTDNSTISFFDLQKKMLIQKLEKPIEMYNIFCPQVQTPFSPGGHLIIKKGKPEKIMLWDFNKNKFSLIYEKTVIHEFYDFSPDGKTFGGIACLDPKKLFIIDMLKNSIMISKCSKGNFKGFAFSPDRNYYAVVEELEDQKRFVIYPFLSGEKKNEFSYQFDVILEGTYLFDFSVDGNRIYWVSEERIKVYEINTGHCLTLNCKTGGISLFKFSCNGKYLAYNNYYDDIFIFTIENVKFGNPIMTALSEQNTLFFRCPVCNTRHDISDSDLGKEYTCSNCQTKVQFNNFICKTEIF